MELTAFCFVVEETSSKIVQLLKDKDLRERLGKEARESVRKKFLLTRYVEEYLDLFNSFEASYKLRRW